MTTDAPTARSETTALSWPVVLCWLAVALEGFDLVVLGATIPTLSKTGALGFTDASLTTASTVGLVGVGIGAASIGPVTDRFGRRRTLLACVAWFSLLTIATALAPTKEAFVLIRFVAGLGLGAVLPIALTYMSEHAPRGGHARAVTRTMTGYHVGAVLTALLGLVLLEPLGWRAMFLVGGIAGLLVLPVMWARLPESETYLEASEQPRAHTSDVVRGRLLWVSVGLWVASFMGLLLVYGLNTWLPTIMGQAGYSIEAGTALLLVLNVGAVLGLLLAGVVSDSRGNKPTVLLWFALAAGFLALLSVKLETTALVYVAVLLTGIFVFSAQVLVYSFVGQLYPAEIRGTALGLSSGIGRLGAISGPALAGVLVTVGIAYPWGFYAFALAAVLAVAALATVPATAPRLAANRAAAGT